MPMRGDAAKTAITRGTRWLPSMKSSEPRVTRPKAAIGMVATRPGGRRRDAHGLTAESAAGGFQGGALVGPRSAEAVRAESADGATGEVEGVLWACARPRTPPATRMIVARAERRP